MVFISFPTNTTSEEDALSKKYEKLDKKRKLLEKANKPEPEVVAVTNNRPLEAKDAKKVIETLKKTGQLPMIQANKKFGFKRKLPQVSANSANKQTKVEEEKREVISYEDDIFDF